MSEMLTRVGGAILLAESQWNPKSGVSKERAMALAAIEAMREPTDAMLAAAVSEPVHLYAERDEIYRVMMKAATDADRMTVQSRWQNMVDAALNEDLRQPEQ